MDFMCPHCRDKFGTASRVQGPDDLQYLSDINHIRELWQCNECDNYFIIEFSLSKITALAEKEPDMVLELPNFPDRKVACNKIKSDDPGVDVFAVTVDGEETPVKWSRYKGVSPNSEADNIAKDIVIQEIEKYLRIKERV